MPARLRAAAMWPTNTMRQIPMPMMIEHTPKSVLCAWHTHSFLGQKGAPTDAASSRKVPPG
jgi:hypothetical protein